MTLSQQKLLNAINSDHNIAMDVIFRASAYRDFMDNPLGYIDSHEYGLKDGLRAYHVSKQCYIEMRKRFGAATDFILDELIV